MSTECEVKHHIHDVQKLEKRKIALDTEIDEWNALDNSTSRATPVASTSSSSERTAPGTVAAVSLIVSPAIAEEGTPNLGQAARKSKAPTTEGPAPAAKKSKGGSSSASGRKGLDASATASPALLHIPSGTIRLLPFVFFITRLT